MVLFVPNVDPGLMDPCLFIWGCPRFQLGFVTFGGEHPHMNKPPGFMNPGSTLVGCKKVITTRLDFFSPYHAWLLPGREPRALPNPTSSMRPWLSDRRLLWGGVRRVRAPAYQGARQSTLLGSGIFFRVSFALGFEGTQRGKPLCWGSR